MKRVLVGFLLVLTLLPAMHTGVSALGAEIWVNSDLNWFLSWRLVGADSSWRPHGYAVAQHETWAVWRVGAFYSGLRFAPLVADFWDWEKESEGQLLGVLGGADVIRLPNVRLSLSGWAIFDSRRANTENRIRAFSSGHLGIDLPVDNDFKFAGTFEATFEVGSEYAWFELEMAWVAQPLPWMQIKLGGCLGMKNGATRQYMFRGIVAGVSVTLEGDDRPFVPLGH